MANSKILGENGFQSFFNLQINLILIFNWYPGKDLKFNRSECRVQKTESINKTPGNAIF